MIKNSKKNVLFRFADAAIDDAAVNGSGKNSAKTIDNLQTMLKQVLSAVATKDKQINTLEGLLKQVLTSTSQLTAKHDADLQSLKEEIQQSKVEADKNSNTIIAKLASTEKNLEDINKSIMSNTQKLNNTNEKMWPQGFRCK